MKLVQTLVVRDEADVIGEHIAFHLNAGVDFVIATDHRSVDGTTEILESFARAGVLRLLRADDPFIRLGQWQTRMARLAAAEHGADWVIPSDADEFWWPRGRSLKAALSAVPPEYGIVRGLTRNFVPLRDDSGTWSERMRVRLASSVPINDPSSPFRPVVKVAHRAHPRVRFSGPGSHQVFGLPWPALVGTYPVEVLHVPLRSREQCARKYAKTWAGWQQNLRGDIARARAASEGGRSDAIWDRVALSDTELERGLASGSVVLDTRLGDALRALRRTRAGRRSLPLPSTSELLRHGLDAAAFDEAELVRCHRRVDDLEAKLARLEGNGRPRRWLGGARGRRLRAGRLPVSPRQ